MTTAYIGQPISRVDGRAKVTGTAKYAAEHNVPDMAYGYIVSSTVAKGRITRIDASNALRLPGVAQVLTHENVPRLPGADRGVYDEDSAPGVPFIPLQSTQVKFSLQPIALVVADSFELARYAASLVRVEYDHEAHVTDLNAVRAQAYAAKPHEPRPPIPRPRGDANKALAGAAAQVDVEYQVPAEYHNPMEPFATTAFWEKDGTLTVFDKTQGVQNIQRYLCSVFGWSDDAVRVFAPFVGGAFGAGLRPQYQVCLAALAAHALRRPVKVSLTRQQMFSLCYRPIAWQRVALGATHDGTLDAIIHEAVSNTSQYEDYAETIVQWSGMLYQCDNVTLDYRLARLDLCTPSDMRGPGAAWGLYALECAMDELAVTLRVDPVDLSLKNYAETDRNQGLPFSSKALRECYRQGAERFGWSRRIAAPRSMREGHTLVGLGMATGAWEAWQVPASARCVLTSDGKATVSSATEDIGTGTYTIMTQIAAEVLGLPIEQVTFALGDSSLPSAPLEGGSFTASSVGSAVKAVCEKVRERLVALGLDSSKPVAFAEGMRHAKLDAIDEQVSVQPSPTQRQYGLYSHSAVFAEVRVDEDLGTVHVARVVTAVAPGRVLNPKTARSQVMGGIVWGIGMALEEEGVIDHAFGRIMNHSLAEYHVAVNADIHDIDVIFVEEQDDIVNPLGVKGLGEIGVVGVAAAIANAVFHATGKRIRELPITLDKLI